jgi:hypothetical protein
MSQRNLRGSTSLDEAMNNGERHGTAWEEGRSEEDG